MKITENLTLLGFIVLLCFAVSGCTDSTDTGAINYSFSKETRNRKLSFRATLKPGNVANITLSKGWGDIEWMADEGAKVASGELVLKINMEHLERRLQRNEKNVELQLALFEKEKKSNPAEIAQLRKNVKSRKFELEKAFDEEKWLKNKWTPDQIWRKNADLRIARLRSELAQNLFQLQTSVTKKGFDSPFSLRSAEIDKISREIELDYAQRMISQIESPPLPEELAQVEFQKTVASGEIWLEESKMQSASISAQIREKNLEVVLERFRSRYRSSKKSLEDAVQYAPRDGVIVHPVLWGNFKFKPGQRAWSGVSIMQVVSEGDYFLEALIPETKARALFEKASATVVLDSSPDRIFTAEVKTIGKSPKPLRGFNDSSFRFLPVEVSIVASESLLVGTQADVSVQLGSEQGVFVPRDLLIIRDRENFVLLHTSFGVEEVKVDVEDFDSDWVLWKDAPEQGVLAYP